MTFTLGTYIAHTFFYVEVRSNYRTLLAPTITNFTRFPYLNWPFLWVLAGVFNKNGRIRPFRILYQKVFNLVDVLLDLPQPTCQIKHLIWDFLLFASLPSPRLPIRLFKHLDPKTRWVRWRPVVFLDRYGWWSYHKND